MASFFYAKKGIHKMTEKKSLLTPDVVLEYDPLVSLELMQEIDDDHHQDTERGSLDETHRG